MHINNKNKSLRGFIEKISDTSIYNAYEYLECDYESVRALNRDPAENEIHNPLKSKLLWKIDPNIDDICRVFNQINTFYAERLFEINKNVETGDLLLQANQILLYRQHKKIGFRSRDIAFGVRKHLPIGDPFRSYKWLLGIAPEHLENAMLHWVTAFENAESTLDSAIFLMMSLIAIHPFSDANGRLARLVFTHFLRQREQPVLYMNEQNDGELLRTGHGVNSTEYLMGVFISEVGCYRNNVEPGKGRFGSKNASKEYYCRLVEWLKSDFHEEILALNSYRQLKTHLIESRHIVERSPRFECLRSMLN